MRAIIRALDPWVVTVLEGFPDCLRIQLFKIHVQLDRTEARAAALLNPGSTAFSQTAPLGEATLSGWRSASFQPNYFIHEASLHLANEVFSVIGIWWPDPLVTSLYKVFISHSLNATGPNYFSFKKQSFPVKFHSSFCFPSLAAI